MYIGDWMGRSAGYWPEQLAVIDTARAEQGRFSYRQMNERANQLASWLRAAGVADGDRVGLVAHNGVECLDAFFACGKLGAICVPYNWRLHPHELAELINQTTPCVLIFSGAFTDVIAQIQPRCPSVTHYLHSDGPGIGASVDYETALQSAPALPISNQRVTAEDICCLLFTGGTSGRAKAAQISYRMIAWNTLNTVVHELNRDDVTITHTPMFHTGGLLVYTIPLLTLGGTVVIMRQWQPDTMLELIERERVTMFFCVPTQYQQLLQSPRFATTDFSRVRFLTSGGAPLPLSLIAEWRAVHDIPFKQGFGMTEFGPGIFSMGPEHAITKAGAIGRPNYFIDAQLVDDDNQPVAIGQVGELVLKGPSSCSGYFDDPQASAECIDAAGWFHTGDLARMDEDGFYFIVDRKKDMFISGGENVYPVEIEQALYGHPAVQQCAVIGVHDAQWGQVGVAAVVLKPAATADAAELLAFLHSRLARYKIPKSIEIMDSLPISSAGKILKRELRQKLT